MRTLWQVANTAWSDLTRNEQDELLGACLRREAIERLGYDPADDGREVELLRPLVSCVSHPQHGLEVLCFLPCGAEDGPEVAVINLIYQNHWRWELDEERARH